MKDKEKMSASKKLTILTVVILVIFAGINLVWLFTTYFPYYGYRDKLETVIDPAGEPQTEKTIGEYRYLASRTAYLSYSNFLAVGSKDGYWSQQDANGNTIMDNGGVDISLYVWPNVWFGNQYGIFFYDELPHVFVQMYVDKELNFLPYDPFDTAFNEEAEGLLSENYTQVKMMMDGAHELWGLNKTGDIFAGIKAYINNITVKSMLILVFMALVIVFAILNMFWFLTKTMPFNRYTLELEKKKTGRITVYQKEIAGILYTVQKPSYLHCNGYLSVYYKNSDEKSMKLSIYPTSGKKRRYVVALDGYGENCDYEGKLNANMEYMPQKCLDKETNEMIKKLMEERRSEIQSLLVEAKELWGLDIN
ncbi:MAG TPA: hypothetical protein VFC76_02405 [Oscillospiraceae bacterium]|nr:hypothetical protein [Oscillospiraceae bacterium]